ncbi:Pectinesterase inhibitor [Senna tora]|uniref:Pectinesterase inhibitor n=1 Tax=Senna tora TaxID=362788 RepID=A0A834WXL1_9FABA|nr:Pectinesterase inhibitor [Senna tora]
MGFSKVHIFLLTLSSFIILHYHSQILVSSQEMIHRECLNITKSDPIPEDDADSKTDIAIILLNCLTTQADTLSSNMLDLGSSERDHTTKTVFQECAKDYASAREDLVSARVALMNNNVGEAVKCVVEAGKANVACHKAIIVYVLGEGKGKDVLYRMMAYDEISESVKRIIGSISDFN